jgi:hypothetical protein
MRVLSLPDKKLDKLCIIEGYDTIDALLSATVIDSVSPAICLSRDNPQCEYTCEMEADQDCEWCEVCGTNTMKSALVLAGVR